MFHFGDLHFFGAGRDKVGHLVITQLRTYGGAGEVVELLACAVEGLDGAEEFKRVLHAPADESLEDHVLLVTSKILYERRFI